MKRIVLLIIAALTCSIGLCQQTKATADSIKHNPEYICAEYADEQQAFEMLLYKVRFYEGYESEVDSTLANVRAKAQSFKYARNAYSVVTFYYVLIKDLMLGDPQSSDNEYNDPVIDYVLKLKNYAELNKYLSERKSDKHDILYKLIRGDDGTRNCYWIVFDHQRTIVAVLDKTLTKDLLTGQTVDYNQYINYPKIWLQTF